MPLFYDKLFSLNLCGFLYKSPKQEYSKSKDRLCMPWSFGFLLNSLNSSVFTPHLLLSLDKPIFIFARDVRMFSSLLDLPYMKQESPLLDEGNVALTAAKPLLQGGNPVSVNWGFGVFFLIKQPYSSEKTLEGSVHKEVKHVKKERWGNQCSIGLWVFAFDFSWRHQ